MKYKIMREFPKAKIGNEIRINKELLTEYKTDDGNWIKITISIPELRLLGWIEEMKLREFFVRVYGKVPVSVCEDIESFKPIESYEIIKVREVLE